MTSARWSVDNDERGSTAWRWLVWLVVIAVAATAGLTWYLRRGSSISVANTMSSCSLNLTIANAVSNQSVTYPVIGTGATSAVAAVHTTEGWLSCVVDQGVTTGAISSTQLSGALSLVVAATDGSPPRDALILVHRNSPTVKVVATSGAKSSTVIDSKDGFDVLQLPIAQWPSGTGTRPSRIGTITGFNAAGHRTRVLALTWCPGARVAHPGARCSTSG